MSISQRLHHEVMMLDDFTCVYCGKRTPDVQIDHLIPASQGGPDVIHNLVAACSRCNYAKGDRQIYQFTYPCYGRFARLTARLARFQGTRRPGQINQNLIPIERDPRPIDELALLRDENGDYLYTKSKIAKMVGRRRIDVIRVVRQLRGELD